jgi:hypothetical protein
MKKSQQVELPPPTSPILNFIESCKNEEEKQAMRDLIDVTPTDLLEDRFRLYFWGVANYLAFWRALTPSVVRELYATEAKRDLFAAFRDLRITKANQRKLMYPPRH